MSWKAFSANFAAKFEKSARKFEYKNSIVKSYSLAIFVLIILNKNERKQSQTTPGVVVLRKLENEKKLKNFFSLPYCLLRSHSMLFL